MKVINKTIEEKPSKKISSIFLELSEELGDIDIRREAETESEDKIHVNYLISTVSSAYEKIRNAVNYQQEQVLRRMAIERIIKRRMITDKTPDVFATNLIKELIHAGYLGNDSVPESKVDQVALILTKYLTLDKTTTGKFNFLGVASAEIENALVSGDADKALVKAFYQVISPKIDDVNSEQLYTALYKTLLRADQSTLKYLLICLNLPEWEYWQPGDTDLIKLVQKTVSQIEEQISGVDESGYIRIARKFSPLFIVLRNTIKQNQGSSAEIIASPQRLHQAIRSVTASYYHDVIVKLHRSIIKAVLFILITKVCVGLALELPYDLYFENHINYLPLVINLLFPPILMTASSSMINIPGQTNTNKLIQMMDELVYYPEGDLITSMIAVPRAASTGWNVVVNATYFIIYGVIFSLMIWALLLLHFNPVSGILFFAFLSTVSFFALRIRKSTVGLLVTEERESVLVSLLDFLLLPFLGIGHWISRKFEKTNIFIFIFDFILEAPFKTVLEVVEQWIGFVRAKKDEIIY